MTAVMGVWATRTLVMVWGTPSSRIRKLFALRPGTNWWVLSRTTLASMLTMGTSTRREDVSLFGFLTLGAAGGGGGGGAARGWLWCLGSWPWGGGGGGGGGGGSSASFFFFRTMLPLSV